MSQASVIASIKLYYRVARRLVIDLVTGTIFSFSTKQKSLGFNETFSNHISQTQPIKANDGSKNKIHNIKIAKSKIESIVIMPGELFSFWHSISKPSIKNNYKEGRTIVKGKLTTSTGGGLCQLSGMIYQLALVGGLQVVERHHHSLDLYTEDTRYTPLGSDATVAYGYKDLRLKNNHLFPVYFRIIVSDDLLEASLYSKQIITKRTIKYVLTKEDANYKIVDTFVDGELLNTSTYKTMNDMVY